MSIWIHNHKVILAIGVLVVLLFAGYVGACQYFYKFAFVPGSKNFLDGNKTKLELRNRKWLATVHKETWYEQAAGHDDWRLTALYVPAARATTKTMVVAHGYMNTKEDMVNYIRMFHDAGYNVLAPDDRGHGESDGTYIGYGWPDRKDYLKWIGKAVQRSGDGAEIGLYGVSMGGATVMYLSGERLPRQVKAIVEDCGYTSVEDELAFQAKSMYHLPKWPLVPGVLLTANVRTGNDFFDANTRTALKKNHLPTFFIHGTEDKFVPTSMVHVNYAATSGKKKLWLVKGAAHAKSLETNPEEYAARVTKFLNQYLR